MNVFTFSGRLASDAEAWVTQAAKPALSFRVANDLGYGEKKITNWIDCKMFGDRTEKVKQYLTKGIQVIVTGEVGVNTFLRKNGEAGGSLNVFVKDLDIVWEKKDDRDQPRAAAPIQEAPKADDIDF